MTEFVTKDSGKKAEYADGMRRDTTEGKGMFRLLFPKGVPYSEQLMTRVADLYARGAAKYGDRNWEKSSSEESLAHHEDALLRHVIKFLLREDDGEDHAAAVVWNVNAVDLTRRNIKKAVDLGKETEETTEPVNFTRYAPQLITDIRDLEFFVGDQIKDSTGSVFTLCYTGWKPDNTHMFGGVFHLNSIPRPFTVTVGPNAGLRVTPLGTLHWDSVKLTALSYKWDFGEGDEIADSSGMKWKYCRGRFSVGGVKFTLGNLFQMYGHLRIDSGPYRGIHINRDGTVELPWA